MPEPEVRVVRVGRCAAPEVDRLTTALVEIAKKFWSKPTAPVEMATLLGMLFAVAGTVPTWMEDRPPPPEPLLAPVESATQEPPSKH